jgi:2'-phosphotransferase
MVYPWAGIKKDGLRPMRRNHVHFAPCELKDATSGARADANVAIYVDVAAAMGAGVKFYRSQNEVILTKGLQGGQVRFAHLYGYGGRLSPKSSAPLRSR